MTERILKFNKDRQILWFLGGIIALSIFSYVFFVAKTVSNISQTQRIQSELSVVSSKIGEMEFDYISKKNSIDINLAYSLGFKKAENTKFIERRTLGQAFSLNIQ